MGEPDKNIREELIELVLENIKKFLEWMRPSAQDGLVLQILKTVLKIPVALFMIFISPVLFIILGIVFVAVL